MKMANESITPVASEVSVEGRDDCLIELLAHDMRSPLTSLVGFLDILNVSVKPRLLPRELACMNSAIHSARNLVEMISSLLDVNRFERGQMSVNPAKFDLAEMMREVLDWFGVPSMQCSIELNSDHEVMVWADEDLTRRILVNLLANALKFTPDNGLVVIEARSRPEGAYVSFYDAGPSIPDSYRQKIFDKLCQLESRQSNVRYASGLGLTFCKLAVEIQGGSIGVECQNVRGSTFWFRLPRTST
jgi:two-component system, sensor histidine kinase and response regulator